MKIDMEADELASLTSGRWLNNCLPTSIGSLVFHSGQVKPGDFFVALETGIRDGHDYVEDAIENGANAVLVRKPQAGDFAQLVVPDTLRALQQIGTAARAKFKGEVIGITGSFGKTSTKELMGKLLGSDYLVTEGNYNNTIGVPLMLSRLDCSKHLGAIIETGINQPGEMETLAAMVRPTQVVFTGVGSAHLEQLKNLETIAYEKSRLIEGAKDPSTSRVYLHSKLIAYEAIQAVSCGKLFIFAWADSAKLWEGIPLRAKSVEPIFYEWKEAEEEAVIQLNFLKSPWGRVTFQLPVCSIGMVENMILSIGVALENGIELDKIQKSLNNWATKGLRGSEVIKGSTLFYLDCYNANPESIKDSLHYFRNRYKADKRLIILGSMRELGDSASGIHRQLAKSLGLQSGERAIFIGEYAEDYARGFEDLGLSSEFWKVYTKRPQEDKWLSEFEGAVFLKGSRYYALEKLVESVMELKC